jgi:hypothetical protein
MSLAGVKEAMASQDADLPAASTAVAKRSAENDERLA